jgi:hypothetical protein
MNENQNPEEENVPISPLAANEGPASPGGNPMKIPGDAKSSIVPSPQQTTITPPQTEEMEVHHPHLHHREKKKFKEYLFEFFMIFFAVTAGFFAENFRENITNNEHEEQYIHSMVEDLKDDTAQMHSVLAKDSLTIKGIDSLLTLLEKPLNASTNNAIVKDAYYLYDMYTGYFPIVSFNDRTLTQLKSSGGMRLIRNQAASDSIIIYDRNSKSCTDQGKAVLQTMFELYKYSYKIFDQKYLRKIIDLKVSNRPPSKIEVFQLLGDSLAFLTTNKGIITEYYNQLMVWRTLDQVYISIVNRQEKEAAGLTAFLQDRYNIK